MMMMMMVAVSMGMTYYLSMQISFYVALLVIFILLNQESFSVSSLCRLSERGPEELLSISSLCSALCSNPAMTGAINLQSLQTHTHTVA